MGPKRDVDTPDPNEAKQRAMIARAERGDGVTRSIAPPQQPSIGRIVHYYPQGAGMHIAAVVTHVWSDTTINATLFLDQEPMLRRVTSLQLGDLANRPDGHFWAWPPRV